MTRTHGTLLAGVAILITAIFLITRQAGSVSEPSQPGTPASSKNAARQSLDPLTKPTHRPAANLRKDLPDLPRPVESPYPPGAAENQEWIETRVAELDRLAWFDDFASLEKILAELRNPLPEIRTAALAATLAFSSRESIPYLEVLARETRDPQEQKALTDAIEHLKLPTMVEELERQKSQPAAPESEGP